MEGCMANIEATAAITGEDKLNQLTKYKASVTANPVFSILAPNVTTNSSCYFSLISFLPELKGFRSFCQQ